MSVFAVAVSASYVNAEPPNDLSGFWSELQSGASSYDGTQTGFRTSFFTEELLLGLTIAETLSLPDIDDTLSWQAHFRFDGGQFGESVQCYQYGLDTLAEIDAQANKGTPTIWRDTLLREAANDGYVAKLSCEFRILSFDFRESDIDLILERLESRFESVNFVAENKGAGETAYTQYRIVSRRYDVSNMAQLAQLQLIVNDQPIAEDDNLSGKFMLLLRDPLNPPSS